MTLPMVSVVIPNYNHGRFLKQRMDSIVRQTYENFEVIILDDFSSDNSREVIAGYAGDPHIREIVLNDKNSGSPFKQWQRGTDLARGEWVWLAESDDYADERFLETMISALENQHHVGLVYCDSKIVSGNTVSSETFATLKNATHKTTRWNENYVNNGLDEIENYILPYGTINNASAVLFNRSVLRDANPFDINLKYIGDKYAFIKVLARSDVAYVRESLNYYRDPFNTRHADKLLLYFYEQFLIFNWVYRNLEQLNKVKFFNAFYQNTRCSMYRNWNKEKRMIFRDLFSVNAGLFWKCIFYNLKQPFFG